MIGDIPEDTFKKKVQQREKANNRKAEIRQVVEMYTTVLVDIIQTFTVSRDVEAMVNNMNGLREHYNSTLEKIQYCYKCSVPLLSIQFNFPY
jgi:hypothetical protein